MSLKQYLVTARALPKDGKDDLEARAIRIQVFAPNEVVAKSNFWSIARRMAKLKKSNGEIIDLRQVIEPEPTRVKTYGIWLTYRSVRNRHNIFKVYRDTTTEGAVSKLYSEMAGTHNTKRTDISIIRISEVQQPGKDASSSDDRKLKDNGIWKYAEDVCRFPVLKQSIRAAKPDRRHIFSKRRPTVCGF